MQLKINGQEIEVLCDTGACRTVLIQEPPNTRYSKDTLLVKTASGHTKAQILTKPLFIRHPESSRECRNQCIVDPSCPVNLLGRDVMTKLNIGVVPTEKGMSAEVMLEQEQQEGFGEPNYYWTLDLPSLPKLKQLAGEHLSPHTQMLSFTEYHNTLYYKHTSGPDDLYDRQVHRLGNPMITLQHLYVTTSGNAVCSVILPENVQRVSKMTKPHVSVAKTPDKRWFELGGVLARVEKDTYKPSQYEGWAEGERTKCLRRTLGWTVKTTPSTHLDDEKTN